METKMAKVAGDSDMENKIVVTLDVCFSSDIMEDLLKSNNFDKWRALLARLEEYLVAESTKHNSTLYKFIGDGWIIFFDEPYRGANIIGFISEIEKKFEKEYKDKTYGVLDSPPDVDGLKFGIDEGPLARITMLGKGEYIGRAINISSRLQGAINDLDIKAGYRALISQRLYNRIGKELSDYSPDPTRRQLRNIASDRPFSCWRLSISETVFKIIKAIYWTGTVSNGIDVTKYYIREIRDNRLDVKVSNSICNGEDPDPGEKKSLTIEYIFEGKKQKRTFKEYSQLQLPPPC